MGRTNTLKAGAQVNDILLVEFIEKRGQQKFWKVKCLRCGQEFECGNAHLRKFNTDEECHHPGVRKYSKQMRRDFSPECCRECKYNAGECKRYHECAKWMAWFNREWRAIRRSVGK